MKKLQIFSDIEEATLYGVAELADSLTDGEEATIEICSHGGFVFIGSACFQKMQEAQARGCRFTARVYGIAASSAADIVLACDRIEMASGSALMIHSAWSGDGRKDQGIEIANQTQLSVIHKRLPQYTETDLEQDHWFTATEALEAGICDSIFGVQSDSPQARLCALYMAHIGGNGMENEEKKEEIVEEIVEEKKEEPKEADPSIEEVLERVAERLDNIEARLVALEGAGCGDDGERKDNARMKAVYDRICAVTKPAVSKVTLQPTIEDPKASLDRFKASFPDIDRYIKNVD